MKKMLGKIAMILIIVMLANCFTGCVGVSLDTSGIESFFRGVGYVFVGALVIGLVVGTINGIKTQNQLAERGPRRTNPYLFENAALKTTIGRLPKAEIDFLEEAFNSMPQEELFLFMEKLNSLPETETVSLIESVNAFSEEELSVIVEAFNSMPETEMASSLQALNSLPETVSLAHIVRNIEVNVSEERAYAGQLFQY
ncbi:MAG: hypothetical protein LBH43_18895 [Treponema sp.]|nr:hypothetical protein [Treponema sp.]